MSHHIFWWMCTDFSEVPAAFQVMDTARTFEMWVHSYNTKMCHIPEDSNTHCNCCGNLTSYNTSVECWYYCLWFHLSRAQGWIIHIKEFKKIYKLPGDLWVQLMRLETYVKDSPVTHSTSANCRNIYYLPFSSVHTCNLFNSTAHLFCILQTVCFLSIILKQWILLGFLI